MTQDPDDLHDLKGAFLAHQRRRRHSPWTLKYYTANIDKFLWWCEHENQPPITHFGQLTKKNLQRFVDYLTGTPTGRFGSTHPKRLSEKG